MLAQHTQCQPPPRDTLDLSECYCFHSSLSPLPLIVPYHRSVTHPTPPPPPHQLLSSPSLSPSPSPSSITSQLIELFSVGCSDQEAAQELRALVGPTVAWVRSSHGQAGRGVRSASAPAPTSTYGKTATYNNSGSRSSYCPTGSARDSVKDTGRTGPSQDDVTELSLGKRSIEQCHTDCCACRVLLFDGLWIPRFLSVCLSACLSVCLSSGRSTANLTTCN